MALADSSRAIGAVTRLLRDHLIRRTQLAIVIGRPEQAASSDTNSKLNIFLYETIFDANLKNLLLHEGEAPPMWLVLKYLLTAFDDGGESDTAQAHELLGRGLGALQEVNFLPLDSLVDATVRLALENNPEALKVTFDETPADLLSKIMQGSDESYRLSVAFQVRPVMIVPAEPPSFDLLVGVDYTASPPAVIGQEGVWIEVETLTVPEIKAIKPDSFESNANDALATVAEITGSNLNLPNLECRLGPAELPVVWQRADRLAVRIGSAIAAGNVISAGEHPLQLRQRLPSGRYRASNLLVARLRPAVSGATAALVTNAGQVSGTITLSGNLLGTDVDDVVLALHRDGAVVRAIDVAAPISNQTTLTVTIPNTAPVPVGAYRLILRVNGQQARNSPLLNLA